ncbi:MULTISPECIES: hypothetical protein [unclassified Porphyromonas]|nr:MULTISPECIES: hypothetical protein [unclassified Porphyromonas]
MQRSLRKYTELVMALWAACHCQGETHVQSIHIHPTYSDATR